MPHVFLKIARHSTLLIAGLACLFSLNVLAFEVEISPHPAGANIELIVPVQRNSTLSRWAKNFTALSRHFRQDVRRYNVVRGPKRRGLEAWQLLKDRGANGHALLFGDTPTWFRGARDRDLAATVDGAIVAGTLGQFTYVLVARTDDGPDSWEQVIEQSRTGNLTVVGNFEGLVSVVNLVDQHDVELSYAKPVNDPTQSIQETRYDLAAISVFDFLNAKNNSLRGLVLLDEVDMSQGGWQTRPKLRTPKDLGAKGISFPRWFAVHGNTSEAELDLISAEFSRMTSFEPYRNAFAGRNLPVDFTSWRLAAKEVTAFFEQMKALTPTLKEAGVAIRSTRKARD